MKIPKPDFSAARQIHARSAQKIQSFFLFVGEFKGSGLKRGIDHAFASNVANSIRILFLKRRKMTKNCHFF
jgi:hypothetical protein